MTILEYSSGQYQQAVSSQSKLLKYLGYSRICKLTKAGNFQIFEALFSCRYIYIYSRNSLKRPPKGLSQKWLLCEVVALVKGQRDGLLSWEGQTSLALLIHVLPFYNLLFHYSLNMEYLL